MDKIIQYVKDNYWFIDDTTQEKVYAFIANIVSAHIQKAAPQTLEETMKISNIYDGVWRTLARMYYEEQSKMVLDFDYYKNTMNPQIIEYYTPKEETEP